MHVLVWCRKYSACLTIECTCLFGCRKYIACLTIECTCLFECRKYSACLTIESVRACLGVGSIVLV